MIQTPREPMRTATPFLVIQPDMQYIIQPEAPDALGNALVVGACLDHLLTLTRP